MHTGSLNVIYDAVGRLGQAWMQLRLDGHGKFAVTSSSCGDEEAFFRDALLPLAARSLVCHRVALGTGQRCGGL
jgi:hypothetical protein